MKNSHLFLGCAVTALSLAVSAQLHAQTAGLEEVIVTAQKRQETAQETPLAIEVLNADALIREGIKDMADITKASPTIEANTRFGGQNVTIGMRGMQQLGTSPTSDGLVAVHLDGAFLASQFGLVGMMYDLARIEVVPGPQGTLYGRNATAGALNLITRRPGNEFEGNASLEYGDYDTVRVQGGVTIPLTDTFSTRIAAQKYTRDSLYTAGGGEQDQWGTRVSAVWNASDRDEVFLSFDYNELGATPETGVLLALAPGAVNPGGSRYIVSDDPYDNLAYQTARGTPANPLIYTGDTTFQEQWGANLQYTHEFDGFSTSLLYAHRDIDGAAHGATRLNYTFSETITANRMISDSAELRFVSTSDGAFKWVGGLFYFENSNEGFFAAPIGPYGGRSLAGVAAGVPATAPIDPSFPLDACPCGGGLFSPSNGTSESYAAYGQTTWTPQSLDRWHFTLGLRYSNDKKTGDLGTPSGTPTFDADGAGPLPPGYIARFIGEESWDDVQYKIGAQYDATDTSMIYASISTGYKAGGFAYGVTPLIEPEKILAYEVGTKNRFLDNTLQLNASAWFYNYTDLESSLARALSPPYPKNAQGQDITTSQTVANVGKARLAGASVDMDWLFTSSDQLGVSITHVYSKVIDGRETGTGIQLFYEDERLGDTPKWAVIGRYGHTFTFAGGATLLPQLKYQWQSEKYDASALLQTPPGPRHYNRQFVTIPSQGLLDVSLRFAPASSMWDVTAYVNNATDETDIKLLAFNDVPTPNNLAPPTATSAGGTFGHQTASLGDPRIWGLILNIRF